MRTQSCVASAASHFTQRYGVTFPLLTSARCYWRNSAHTYHPPHPTDEAMHTLPLISAFDELLDKGRLTRAVLLAPTQQKCLSLIAHHSLSR